MLFLEGSSRYQVNAAGWRRKGILFSLTVQVTMGGERPQTPADLRRLPTCRFYRDAGTAWKSAASPSDIVGSVKMVSRKVVYGSPAVIATWIVVITSPAYGANAVKPRMRSLSAATSAL
jgi:hypothetical protein